MVDVFAPAEQKIVVSGERCDGMPCRDQNKATEEENSVAGVGAG